MFSESLCGLIAFKLKSCNYSTQSNHLTLDITYVCTDLGRAVLRYYVPFNWKTLQTVLKLDSSIPQEDFIALLYDVFITLVTGCVVDL